MILLYILLAFWVLLIVVASLFAKRAGETKWLDFWIINLVPFAGSILSIYLYSINIGQKQNNEHD